MSRLDVSSEVGEDDVTFRLNEQPSEAECVGDDIPTTSQDARRSQRVRTLTEKGQELHDEQVKKAAHRFSTCYEKWKAVIKETKKAIDGQCSMDLLDENITKVNSAATNVCAAYDDLRRIDTPDNDTRRRMDTCDAVTRSIMEAAERSQTLRNRGQKDEEVWKVVESVFKSAASARLSVKSHHSPKTSSKCSSRHSSKRQEAAAEVAANEAALEVQLEQENRIREIEKQEAEIAQKQRELEAKRREVDRLETIKSLQAAKARQRVYEQSESSEEDTYDVLHQQSSGKEKRVKSETSSLPLRPPFPSQYVFSTPEVNTKELVRAFAESLNASRLPVPEPTIFNGDPLRYNDWKISFLTLVDRKALPAEEKTYYLRKYVSGPARKAIESYFLLGTESAYNAAWTVLEDRYGNPFLIAKAFRDKLDAWPKISSKGSVELQEYADFLRSCNAAMPHIKGLEVLNDCNENQKMLTKLPDWLTSRWNRKVTEVQEQSHMFPSFSDFVAFISCEAKIACNPITSLYALKPRENDKTKLQTTRTHGAKVMALNSNERAVSLSCVYCEKAGHSLQKCFKFMNENIGERLKFAQEKKLCFGCLKVGHRSKDCHNRETCDTCKKKHPTCLHDTRTKEERTQTKNNEARSTDKTKQRKQDSTLQDTNFTQTTSEATSNRVMQNVKDTHTSSIVPVWVSAESEPEREVLVYALLDTQSDTTFILQETARALHTVNEVVQLRLTTMSSRNTVVTCHKLSGLQVRGFYSNQIIPLPVTYTRDFIPANRDHIPTPATAKAWPHLEHIADEIAPLQSCDVGLLIGYNCPQALIPRQVVSGKENQPFGQKTDLGWSIVGFGNPRLDYGDAFGVSHKVIVKQVVPGVQPSSRFTNEVHYVCRTQIKEMVSPANVIKLLESDFAERAAEDVKISQEDLRFLTKMKEGIRLKEDGHFEMPLPFKSDKPNLPDNKSCAIHRLRCLERKLRRNKQYYMDYKKFMEEIIAHGDAEKVPEQDINNTPAWYIPHHGVYHPQKPGKIRIVFDGSAKFQGTSINDHLLTGPELTNTLLGVLCRFRRSPVAIMCDIERMFHQFHVCAADQDYLRFLWWENGDLDTPFTIYRMKVHLFGAASSPGCANYGLKHLAAEGEGRFSKETVKFIKTNFYVDDGLASVDTESQAVQLVKEARELCSTGKLRLHKFISNSTKVLYSLPKEECLVSAKNKDMALSEIHIERALGVQWCVESDQFQFRVTVKENPLTRRGVLSTVASVFDPLGFVSPFILLGKQILQQMCRDKLSWDDTLPENLRPQWESWLLDLRNLAKVKIQRCYTPNNFKAEHYELHHFSDASASGYGMCTYLRAVSTSGEVHCSLVMGRSRVPPSKVTTIPRLELSAAVVAVRTGDMLKKELEVEMLQETYWTDSKVVLGYIANEARRFHVFVANRVERIKQSTEPEQWRYVASEENPADHASRGLTAEQLISSNWFQGPDFLWQKVMSSGEIKVGEISSSDPEVKKVQVLKTQAKEQRSLLDRIHKFSDWSRMIKAIARLKRLAKEVKERKRRSCEVSNVEERREAELTVIKMVQGAAFSHEIKSLQNPTSIQTKDIVKKLHKLSAFLDDQGSLRVGGRLKHAALHSNIKHPVILPRDSHVSMLLIKHYHEKTHHQGRGITMNELRASGYWILGCSKVVSSYIHRCVKCRKFRRCTEQQKMADLPKDRMETTPPFTYCGMDCFGPFYVKEGRKELKRYGLLITCMCSRAVHIEMLDDLTTDAFINALRAFIAIRGSVRQIRCDQGTNFVGARNEFAEAFKEMDQIKLENLECEFLMNTPASSHMGGVWERQIRTIRSVLSSILEQSAKQLDSSSLRTFLYEVMAVINSRPLTTDQLCDPSSPEPLTPNHILTMKSTIISPPPGKFVKEDLYLQKRWRRVQLLANTFWTRWKKEYLLNLQSRQKWTKQYRNAQINDIVLLKDEITPRNQWKLAKIVDVYPSKDQRVRKVKLLMSDRTLDEKGKRISKPVYLERPIQKTVVLLEAN
ncbi:uncharacterized protein LOC111946470 [Oryzias latipes]|uniref:uncharacterized protein LOC111946470 n=1 Tax=Oryzias latipes TaxID=8090 RepID=UPI000CE27693|nr:uncharacterized protein LOC111946470 [Oryzias latipes]XP_023805607.1 uncharacterized protein LOC111946470 [Oryzias latipes]XP_023805608.1 uncharacterized protein LOC111946470 [Oryzias latipes]XP_023805609.1 uncharacterized protein LOC111946470 [Oryzias latipes]